MELHKPHTVVHSVQHIARGAQAEKTDVRAQDNMRAVEQRVQAPSGDEMVRYEKLRKDADGALVTNGRVAGHSVDSAEAYEIVKNVNTQTDLKISRWSEIAGYLKWGTLGLMTMTFGAFASVATGGAQGGIVAGLGSLTGASVGAALVAPAFVGLLAAALVVGGAGMFMTQQVRKLQANRWMDVQGFMQERAATKIGQQVSQSLGVAPEVQGQDVAVEQAAQHTAVTR
jgi:hypothetical protein